MIDLSMNRIATVIVIIILVAGGIFIFLPKTKKTETPPASKVVSAPAKINEVSLTDKSFSPQSITIKKGETLRWSNKSRQEATVNSDPHPTHTLYKFLNLGRLAPGASFQAEFQNTGTFTYHNHFNAEQKGTVIVK